MSMNLEDLEKGIERKISEMEREKTRLKDDLRVVRQASVIAADFEGTYGTTEWSGQEEYEEPQPQDSH